MEFHDIKDRHTILFGEDLVASLDIDDRFYRAMVEHELRAQDAASASKGRRSAV